LLDKEFKKPNREFGQGDLGSRKTGYFLLTKGLGHPGWYHSETWKKKCKIGLFEPEEIRLLQNNKSAATQHSFHIFLKDFTDDNINVIYGDVAHDRDPAHP